MMSVRLFTPSAGAGARTVQAERQAAVHRAGQTGVGALHRKRQLQRRVGGHQRGLQLAAPEGLDGGLADIQRLEGQEHRRRARAAHVDAEGVDCGDGERRCRHHDQQERQQTLHHGACSHWKLNDRPKSTHQLRQSVRRSKTLSSCRWPCRASRTKAWPCSGWLPQGAERQSPGELQLRPLVALARQVARVVGQVMVDAGRHGPEFARLPVELQRAARWSS